MRNWLGIHWEIARRLWVRMTRHHRFDVLRHSVSSHPLSWCLSCEEAEHLKAWDQTRCPEHGDAPILEAWPDLPEENWDYDIELTEVAEDPEEPRDI